MSDESCNDTTDNNNLQECTEDKTVVSGKWLTSQQLYQELNNSNDIFSTVSIGRKNNKFFVVDNSSNSTRQQNQQRSNSFDDCGVWASGQAQSSKTIFLKICNKWQKRWKWLCTCKTQWCLFVGAVRTPTIRSRWGRSPPLLYNIKMWQFLQKTRFVVYIHRKYRYRQKSSVWVLREIPKAKSKFLPNTSRDHGQDADESRERPTPSCMCRPKFKSSWNQKT